MASQPIRKQPHKHKRRPLQDSAMFFSTPGIGGISILLRKSQVFLQISATGRVDFSAGQCHLQYFVVVLKSIPRQFQARSPLGGQVQSDRPALIWPAFVVRREKWDVAQVGFQGSNASGTLCFNQAHFGRTMLPKWPLWAHLLYSVFLNFYSASATRMSHKACFRQAHCFM